MQAKKVIQSPNTPDLSSIVLLSVTKSDPEYWMHYHKFRAMKLHEKGIKDNQLSAWVDHIYELHLREGDPDIDIVSTWTYRYLCHTINDVIVLKYEGNILGLMRVHYTMDKRNNAPTCIVEIVQGNEKADEKDLLKIKDLRENIFTTFLYSTRPLINVGWQLGLTATTNNKRLRDRYAKNEVHTFPTPIVNWATCRREYWQCSPDKRRIQEIYGNNAPKLASNWLV